jgi:hypothetical protein
MMRILSTSLGCGIAVGRLLGSWARSTRRHGSRVSWLGPRVLLGSTLALCLSGCGSPSGPARPGSGAGPSPGELVVRFLTPSSGQTIIGSVARVQVLVRGVRLVNKVGKPNVPGEGHLRLWVDPEDISSPSLVQTASTFDLTGLAPGPHRLMVELRQNDDTPLAGAPASAGSDSQMHKELEFSTVSALGRIQTEIFSPTCAAEGCHVLGGAGPMPLTDAGTSYQSLVGVLADNGMARSAGKKRVVPGHPEQSFLLRKLTRQLEYGEGDPMPQNAPPLTGEQIELIRLWISQGAAPAP